MNGCGLMPKMDISGIEQFSSFMQSLEGNAEGIIKMGVYDGAGVVADEVRRAIQALPIDHGRATEERKLNGINELQRQGLLDGFGISGMENKDNFTHVKIGFSGYNSVKTRKFPNGQPNVLIARSIESGSSVIQKKPFVRPAINRVKARATQAVQNTITEEINKLERK